MNSRTTRQFRAQFALLPREIKQQAAEAYKRFMENPNHPGLRFKRVHIKEPIYSARISRDYRAVGVLDGDEVVWFWIGPHDAYEMLLARLG